LHDFADFEGETDKCPGKYQKGIYLKVFTLSLGGPLLFSVESVRLPVCTARWQELIVSSTRCTYWQH